MRGILLAAAALVTATSLALHRGTTQEIAPALESITAHELRAHLRFLSHDLLEGRAPGTRGGALASLYIATQFRRAGLRPAGDGDTTFRQTVPLVARTPVRDDQTLRFVATDHTLPADRPSQAVFWSAREDEDVSIDGELVFAGYGVHAPEYDWDDFGEADLEGKILLVLINDPPAPPHDPERFDGAAMTYYGRWTYKFEEARRRGAAGALVVHSPGPAGYPWSVVRNSWSGARLVLPDDDDDDGRPPALGLEGWLHRDFAADLLSRAGLNLEELYVLAARRDFRPIETEIAVHAELPGTVRRLETANVVGMVPGTDPARRDEAVVFTAHYDHLGIGEPDQRGDSIYNGAYDNASGVALLIEMAEAFARAPSGPARSVLFIATTAEEAGLLGAEHYVRHPIVPLARTAAAINIDGANLWGETDDVVALGAEHSSLDAHIERATARLGLRVSPDRAPERGYFFRSDHFPFARAGVPALSLEHGLRFRGRPDGWGDETLARYDAERYHRPGDEFDPGFDLAGAVQQARLATLLGWEIAQADSLPRWNPSTRYGPRPALTTPSDDR
ncbi:MAG: M28 family peptidase [Gemmatimonadota bacterium]